MSLSLVVASSAIVAIAPGAAVADLLPAPPSITTLPSDHFVIGFAVDGGHWWTANYYEKTVTELDPNAADGPAVLTTIHLPSNPGRLLIEGRHLWVASNIDRDSSTAPNSVTEIDLDAAGGPAIVATLSVDEPVGLAFDGTHLWALGSGTWNQELGRYVATVSEFDPNAAGGPALLTSIDVCDNGQAISADASHVWVACGEGKVAEIATNPSGVGTLVEHIPVGVGPIAIDADGTHVWVANRGTTDQETGITSNASISEIDAADPSHVSELNTYPGDLRPQGLVSDGTHLWVTTPVAHNQGLLTEILINGSDSPTWVNHVGNYPNGSVSLDGTTVVTWGGSGKFERIQQSLPSPPRPRAIPDGDSATVEWGYPYYDGGSPITSYTVRTSFGGRTCTTTTTSCTFTGLDRHPNWTFSVAASTSGADGPSSEDDSGVWSETTAPIPVGMPGTPTDASVIAGPGSATVSWSPPVSDGGRPIESYTVSSEPENKTCTSTGTTCVIDGLKPGTSYVFDVRASSSLGDSDPAQTGPMTPDRLLIPVGSHPSALAADAHHVWVANQGDGTVTQIDSTAPGGPAVVATIPVGENPRALTWDGTHLWVANGGGAHPSTISEIDPNAEGGPAVVHTVTFPLDPDEFTFTIQAIATDGTHLWATKYDNWRTGDSKASVIEIDPAAAGGPAVVGSVAIPANCAVGMTAYTYVWVADQCGSAVYQVDPNAPGGPAFVGSVDVGGTASAIAEDTDHVWVTLRQDNSLVEIDPLALGGAAVVGRLGNVGNSPTGLTVDGGNVWTANSPSFSGTCGGTFCSSVSKVSYASPLSVVERIPVGSRPTAVASDGENVWVTNDDDSTVTWFPTHDVPSAPRVVTAHASGPDSATVEWSPPLSYGRAPITGYRVSTDHGHGPTWEDGPTCSVDLSSSPDRSCVLTGLDPQGSYQFRVAALNSFGESEGAWSQAVTLGQAPPVPTDPHVSVGSTSATVSWTPGDPGSDGGPDSYVVTAVPGGQSCTVTKSGADPLATSCEVLGLNSGSAYRFSIVSMRNGISADPVVTDEVSTGQLPDAPSNVTADLTVEGVTVSWDAPGSDGGSAISGYSVHAVPGGQACSTAALSCTVTGLSPGQSYTFSVVASNDHGDSDPATSGAVQTPPGVPSVPRQVQVTQGIGQLTFQWQTPASDGGREITRYTASATRDGVLSTCQSTELSCTIVGLDDSGRCCSQGDACAGG